MKSPGKSKIGSLMRLPLQTDHRAAVMAAHLLTFRGLSRTAMKSSSNQDLGTQWLRRFQAGLTAIVSRCRRNLPGIVTHGLAALLYAGCITTSFGGSMVETYPLTAEEKAEARQRAMLGIGFMGTEELTESREVCVMGKAGLVKADFESRYGVGSSPEVPEYCNAALRTAVEKGPAVSALYIDLAIQQMGLGTGYDFQSQGEAVAGKPAQLVRAIRNAADEGKSSYVDVAGDVQPLICPLALDAGATWAAANVDRVNRPYFTEEQAEKIAEVCYNPDIQEVNNSKTGQRFTIQQAGLAAGEILGRKWKLASDLAGTSGVNDGYSTTGAILQPTPLPPLPPERPGKQANMVGG